MALPTAEGEQPLSDAAKEGIAADREACRATVGQTADCDVDLSLLPPVAGPVREATDAELAESVRQYLAGTLAGDRVTRPIPGLDGTAAPLPSHACITR